MGKRFRPRRVIPVKNLDGTWGRLDTSECVSVQGFGRGASHSEFFLHKSPNKRWYEEDYDITHERSRARELSLEQAVDWLLGQTFSNLTEFKILEDLPDVSRTETPPHGGGVVVKCLKCRAMSKLVKDSPSSTEKAIVTTMKGTKDPLSGREIAKNASLTYNSSFRSTLSRLVSRRIVVKTRAKGGYVLADKSLS